MEYATIFIVLACAFGFFMAWGVGANDVANAMGTSVGSRALTIRQAVIVAAIFEFAGAYLAGGQVTETIRSGMLDANLFADQPQLLVYGMLASLLAAGIWLMLASQRGWPVSTTHSIVGAIVGFAAVGVGMLIGIPLGLFAGLRGGWADFAVMRLVDVMTAFPGLLFAIFLMTVLGAGVGNIILVIGLTSWLTLCRLVRAQLLTLREQEYITAARCIGASEASIAFRHLLPNALAPVIVAVTLSIPTAIFAEAGLSYLGVGINEPTPSLGKMVADSAPYIRLFWHLGLFPTAAIALIMLGFSFVGDGLRDALDPRQT